MTESQYATYKLIRKLMSDLTKRDLQKIIKEGANNNE